MYTPAYADINVRSFDDLSTFIECYTSNVIRFFTWPSYPIHKATDCFGMRNNMFVFMTAHVIAIYAGIEVGIELINKPINKTIKIMSNEVTINSQRIENQRMCVCVYICINVQLKDK